jgi:phytoene dehydrogenase-like protein
MNHTPSHDIAILGGGLAGLTAALIAARAGRSVAVFEKASHLGGRATTQETGGFYFNQGPHALYRAGQGARILKELGIAYAGHRASYEGSWVLYQGQRHPLPGTPEKIQASAFLSPAAKAELLALQSKLMSGYPTTDWQTRSAREWLDTQIIQPESRALLEGQMRLATYCGDSDRLSAGAALDQMIVASQDGVDYLDDGWQTLVTALETAALAAGVTLHTRHAVTGLEFHANQAVLHFSEGTPHTAKAVISTVPPAAIARLVGPQTAPSLQRWAENLVPVHAACLDVALQHLPEKDYQFAIGLDQPLYYSVHTRSARLAPEGGSLIQVAKYLKADEGENGPALRSELETLMDTFQPGWQQAAVVHQRFLPRMLVTHAIVSPAGRPPVAVPELPKLHLAGDWVGPQGMLVDASLVSARAAAQSTLDYTASARHSEMAAPARLSA